MILYHTISSQIMYWPFIPNPPKVYFGAYTKRSDSSEKNRSKHALLNDENAKHNLNMC